MYSVMHADFTLWFVSSYEGLCREDPADLKQVIVRCGTPISHSYSVMPI